MTDQLKLSDEDIDKIVGKVCNKLKSDLYQDVGKGILQLVFRGVLIGLLAIALYGVTVKNWLSFLPFLK